MDKCTQLKTTQHDKSYSQFQSLTKPRQVADVLINGIRVWSFALSKLGRPLLSKCTSFTGLAPHIFIVFQICWCSISRMAENVTLAWSRAFCSQLGTKHALHTLFKSFMFMSFIMSSSQHNFTGNNIKGINKVERIQKCTMRYRWTIAGLHINMRKISWQLVSFFIVHQFLFRLWSRLVFAECCILSFVWRQWKVAVEGGEFTLCR